MPTTTAPSVIRIALLVTGGFSKSIEQTHGGNLEFFQAAFGKGLEQLKAQGKLAVDTVLEMEGFDVCTGVYPEDIGQGWDAMLLTGSEDDAYADEPWINNLVKYVQNTREHHPQVKLLGVCFGHQLIGRAFGAKVGRNTTTGLELGLSRMETTTLGEEFWGKKALYVQEIHNDIVFDLPKDFSLLLTNNHTMVQSMVSNDNKVLTTQGHPEFTPAVMRLFTEDLLASTSVSIELAEAALKTMDNEVDDVLMCARMVQFVAEKN